ncbi:hypothetical protein ACWEC4_12490 [Streptomyces sp. NPDC005055]
MRRLHLQAGDAGDWCQDRNWSSAPPGLTPLQVLPGLDVEDTDVHVLGADRLRITR